MRAACLLVIFATLLAGQAPNQSRLGEMYAPAGQSEQLPPELRKNAPHLVSITIKVVLEGGESLSVAPLVMDARSEEGVCRLANIFKNGSIRLEIAVPTETRAKMDSEPARATCFLPKVMLPGYRSFSGTVQDQQVIVLARLGEHEGSTVSVTSLSAPEKARRAYEQGEAALSRQKYVEAQKHFEQATSIYPAYAMAWSELGIALERQDQMSAAAEAYRKAAATDPKYIKPLVQLAGLAGRQQHWDDERTDAAAALKLHPVEFPGVYYYFAEACFHLARYPEAEDAARSAIEVDQHHEFPQAYLLLAAVLAQKGDRDAAVKELREYLKAAPHAGDAPKIREQVVRLAQNGSSH
ncbi:MAG: tetratricopeptide repeat protein [Bryobacteraceae bacterium]